MKNTMQYRNWISRMRLAVASAALALVVAPVLAVIAIQPAQAQTFTTLASFDGTNGGDNLAPLVQATNGKLYGSTIQGGSTNNGNIFELTTGGTLTSLYSFCTESGCPDGDLPNPGLVQETNGNFYGITEAGGGNGFGSVFEVTPGGALKTIYSFCTGSNCSDGDDPTAGLVLATNGYLYGTTGFQGINGGGTIFKMTPAGELTTLYNFCNIPSCGDDQPSDANGFYPTAGLMQASNGDLYGTTVGGGVYGGTSYNNAGTIFKISPGGEFATLYSFCAQVNADGNCTDGSDPSSVLVQASNGNIYGTTGAGGANGFGTIFEITTNGTFKFKTLYTFCSQSGCADGGYGADQFAPKPGLIQATDGNLYGTTSYYGANSGDTIGYGTIFEFTPGGTLTTLYSFCSESDCADGGRPYGGLVQDTNGVFYGTTSVGGVNYCPKDGGTCGTVYSFSVGLGPFVEPRPAIGKVGAAIKILGTKLTGATTVTFNGTPATFTVVSNAEITTSVPIGATTGNVEVTTPHGTLMSNVNFRVIP
jgi:uncharacterized repeat protein (TIGR03803 family)